MSMVLSQVYLEPSFKRSVSAHAKKQNRTVSDLAREGLELTLMGMSKDDMKMLDAATKQMEKETKKTGKLLDQSAKEHKAFIAEIARIRARVE
jgi:hypothetical protein